MRVLFRSLDLETTGIEPPQAEVVEIGFTDVLFDTDSGEVVVDDGHGFLLFNPPGGIPAEAIAVHHIQPRMVMDLAVCTVDDLKLAATCINSTFGEVPSFLLAHNAAYEKKFFTPEITGDLRWLCSMKTAARTIPDRPGNGLQAIRYHLGLLTSDEALHKAHPPHRAGPDAYVAAHLLAYYLLTGVKVKDMVKWTAEPLWMEGIPFGKHKGTKWADLPGDYVQWMLRQPDLDADVKHWANLELERRREAYAHA